MSGLCGVQTLLQIAVGRLRCIQLLPQLLLIVGQRGEAGLQFLALCRRRTQRLFGIGASCIKLLLQLSVSRASLFEMLRERVACGTGIVMNDACGVEARE